jgi:hypothetical protein
VIRCRNPPSPISRNRDARRAAADLRNRGRQHVDAVPAAERAGEADDAVAAVETQLALQLPLVAPVDAGL